ncbi:hypothetical protein ECC02_012459 [Trypanosoma cruzi]|uniref:Nucleolar RNA helicase II n=1 Tax=Trypanosoma cruzi TaxID=5693 RepID=A0A7J6XK52_TRYCR|nr:hypothetical protein ECC02_012459 [Trypanosoma cruzi]
MGALNHNTSKTINLKSKRSVGRSAHTHSHCSRKAKHTHRERERGRPLNATETQNSYGAPPMQPGRTAAVRVVQKRAPTGLHGCACTYIQWAHYVCASWGEVRARVHARGHTQRVSEGRVCVRAVHGSLSLTLTRPPPQPHTQQQEEEAKEGRWCGVSRCCCHCFVYSSYQLCWRLLSLLLYLPQSLLSLCLGGFVVWLRSQAAELFFYLHS